MKLLRPFCRAAVAFALGFFAVRADDAVPLVAAVASRQIALDATGNARDQLTLTLHNPADTPVSISIPAGLIAAGHASGSRVIVLRGATATVPAKSAVEVSLPVAALSSKNVAAAQSFDVTADSEPRLTALLAALSNQPDAPRATAQLAVLSLLENVTFAQWRNFSGTASEAVPTTAEVTQAIDALGLLRTIAPQQSFALADDPELKMRALHNPGSRGKAMAIYGLALGDGAPPPDLRQLLHTAPGDNCPICRQRALMQQAADIP